MSPHPGLSMLSLKTHFGETLSCSNLDSLTLANLLTYKKVIIDRVILENWKAKFWEITWKKEGNGERNAREERLVRNPWLMWNTVFMMSWRKPLGRLLEAQFPVLYSADVCIKNKTKFKLQSKNLTFRAAVWTICFEWVAAASLQESVHRKYLKQRL